MCNLQLLSDWFRIPSVIPKPRVMCPVCPHSSFHQTRCFHMTASMPKPSGAGQTSPPSLQLPALCQPLDYISHLHRSSLLTFTINTVCQAVSGWHGSDLELPSVVNVCLCDPRDLFSETPESSVYAASGCVMLLTSGGWRVCFILCVEVWSLLCGLRCEVESAEPL